jgi:alanine racemase
VEIDLGAISHNVRLIKEMVGERTAVMAVVKANGYGHGAVQAARAALRGGASWLGVSSVAEGLELRSAGVDAPILNLGYTPSDGLAMAADAGISLTIYEGDSLRAMGALSPSKKFSLQVKVNTGMNRLGVAPDQAAELVKEVRRTPNVRLEGLYTHFADADGRDPAFTRKQLEVYLRTRDRILADGGGGFISHAANSAAALRFPESWLDLVRVGISVYGVSPAPGLRNPSASRPALRWMTLVTNVQELEPGATVGYGRTFKATGPARVATLAAGYADGLHRLLSNRGKVVIRGRLAPIIGTISMDQATVDVSQVPGVAIGDAACLIGAEGEARWEAEDVAASCDTIAYEVLCAISARVPRKYIDIPG